jgi:hypothetical protein
MAVTCTPEALTEASACFITIYSAQICKAITVRNLCAYINGETMECSADALSDDPTVACLTASLSEQELDAIIAYLSCQIASGGGGGGGLAGHGSPEGVVSASPGQTYWDQDNDTLWVKDSGSGTNTGWYNY